MSRCLCHWALNICAYSLYKLKRRDLLCSDVTHVICTHGHSDHVGNLNLFTNALQIVGQSISHKDEYQFYSFENGNPYKISENIDVISTPGHTLCDVSVIVKNSELGTVAVVGDLFEKGEDIEDPYLWRRAGSENPVLQFENRQKMLILADTIIPGHGPPFKVSPELIPIHASQE